MISFEERIAISKERVAQEERRRIRDMNRENERQRKINTRRQIIVGGIVAKYFPDVINLQPQLNRADTDIEFANMERFISLIADDPRYSALFQELVVEKSVGGNHQR